MAKRTVLFVQGAGEGAYQADELLAESLDRELGPDYRVRYPAMPDEANSPYDLWRRRIAKEIDALPAPVLLVGHSVGASHLAKCLTEMEVPKRVSGIFLLATPFWGGEGWRYQGYTELVLPADAAARLPTDAKVFLYHARDDEIVSFTHLALYAGLLPQAATREVDKGGHQLHNDLSLVAKDMKTL